MSENTHPRQATLFLALTRPALIWGQVPFDAFWYNAAVSICAGLMLQGHAWYRMPLFIAVFVWGCTHLVLIRLTRWDYYWDRLFRLWLMTALTGGNELVCLPSEKSKSGKDCSSAV
jgi:type IV secretory pathway VirB3-like protein